jgi:predicted nucleotidyltransferase
MEEKIKKYLADLEKDKGIQILLACETASRAWGFPSPDSDYDVRIIYKHPKDWYLSLVEEKDSIEYFFENNDIDISGWDLRKSLRLLWKSNPPLLERIQSPIIYQVDQDFLNEINVVAQKTYSRIATIHHYLSMAKKSFEEINNVEAYKLKKFFMPFERLLLAYGF